MKIIVKKDGMEYYEYKDGILEVKFDKIYQYKIPLSLAYRLNMAPDKVSFFNKYIRKHKI